MFSFLSCILQTALVFYSFRVAPDRISDSFDWAGYDAVILENAALSDNRVEARSVYTKDSLYLDFRVSDSDLRAHQTQKDHPELFLDDMIEFLFDCKNDRTQKWAEDDIIYHVNILGQKKDDRGTALGESDPSWDGRARLSVKCYGTVNHSDDVDSWYEIFAAIPWKEPGRKPRKGTELGFNFACGDNDGKGRCLFAWSPSDPIRNPGAFGILKCK